MVPTVAGGNPQLLALSDSPDLNHVPGVSAPVKKLPYPGLKITDSRLLVMMTGQIFFKPGQTPILAGQIMNTVIFLPGISNYVGNRPFLLH